MIATPVKENKRIATDWFDQVWNKGEFDSDALANGYHVITNMGSHDELTAGEYQGTVAHFHDAFPDLHKEINEAIATDDEVVIQYTLTGTHEGDLMEIPPTGNKVEIEAVDIVDIESDGIARELFVADFLRLMRQLEVVE